MAAFDAVLWRDRAWARQVARAQSSPDDSRWAEDVLAIQAIALLVDWCTSRGLSVDFSRRKNGLYDSETKTIHITSRAEPLRQAVYLSHEIGHHLIGNDHVRFAAGYPSADNPDIKNKFVHKLACLEEEIEAWQRGRKLLERLRAPVPVVKFDEIRIECLKSYVKWAARKGG